MRKLNISTLIAAVAFVGGITVLPASPALAQSGSRLCGKTALTPSGAIGILYEARDDDKSYSKQCSEAINTADEKIKADAKLSMLTWTTQSKATCESVGPMFQSGNSEQDMCKNMEAKKGYLVTMTKSTNSTDYAKQ